nr:MAG TPA: hypothetical protein [Caudoviricetes sp.]
MHLPDFFLQPQHCSSGTYQTIQCCQMRHGCIKYCKSKESISFKKRYFHQGESLPFFSQ